MPSGRPASVFVRTLNPWERTRLKSIVRRGAEQGSSVTWRRALVVSMSARGMSAPEIARSLGAKPDWVRGVIASFNRQGVRPLQPRWAGGPGGSRGPCASGSRPWPPPPHSCWESPTPSGRSPSSVATCSANASSGRSPRSTFREILHEDRLSLQRTKSWKWSPDPEFQAKAARVLELYETLLPPEPGQLGQPALEDRIHPLHVGEHPGRQLLRLPGGQPGRHAMRRLDPREHRPEMGVLRGALPGGEVDPEDLRGRGAAPAARGGGSGRRGTTGGGPAA